MSTTIVPMDRDERVRRFGIECIGPEGDGIFFRAGTWRPGGEYVQKLIIRNVSTTVKKLKYKLPSTRYFSMFYPEPIVLSPGLSQEVDVVFRPVEYEPYDDTIYIKMLDGIDGNGFHIPVRATIDNLALSVPDGLDLGYCATHQITQLTFQLVNVGEIDAPYEWEVPEPFRLVPSSGVVPVGQHHDITLSIRPVDASVFVSQALCRVGMGVHAIIPNPVLLTKLSAIGKFAYINLSDSKISFEEVVSGTKPDKKEIVLYNNSVVPAEFQLVRLDGDRDEVFDIEPKAGVIPPRGELPITIQYKALAMGCYTHDRYAYRTPGNCNTVLTLKGTSMPPKISLFKDTPVAMNSTVNHGATASMSQMSNSMVLAEEGAPMFSLNFRDVELGNVETRLLYLSNDSPREVFFSVVGDDNGIFKMHPKQGVIPALFKSFPVKVVFVPNKPINFYRRFFVLVGDALPLFYDCMGTGFIRAKGEVKEQRPAPIRHAHVQAYRNRSVQGLGGLSPDELDRLHENPDFPQHYFAQIGRTGTRALSVTSLQRPVTRTGESVRNLVAPAHEFFIENTDSSAKEVVMNKVHLDFGFTPSRSSSAPQTVVIHNNTKAKVMVQWNIPVAQGMDLVTKHDSSNVRSSKEREVITVDRAEKELSKLQAFTVSPAVSEIPAGQSQSFEVTFCPKQSSRNFISELEVYVFFKNQRTFRLVNDFSLTPPWCLTVSALGHTFSSGQLLAKAVFQGGNISHGKLVFPCCFSGESIYQTFVIRNTSNLPATFSVVMGWRSDLPASNVSKDGVFTVKPSTGEIAAESFVLVCVRFSPKDSKKYTELMRLVMNGDDGGKLLLEGTGALPYLVVPDLSEGQAAVPEQLYGLPAHVSKAIPKGPLGDLYLKPTCVGLSSTRKVTLKNASRLPLKFRVQLPNSADNILSIYPMHGVLKGNDDIHLEVTFQPKETKAYDFKVQVFVYPIGGKPKRVLDANQPGPVDPPELLQHFSVALHGQGDVGAILFDPPYTEVDVRLVHTSEEKAIWLENTSDSDLSYKLFYKEEFEADVVDQPVSRVSTEVMDVEEFHDFDPHKKSARSSFQHSLFCSQPYGVIAARSRFRVVFLYKPAKSGLFEFSIYAQIQALDPSTKQPLNLSNDEAALLRLTGADLSKMGEVAADVSTLALSATISARAAFPKLLFEDIRTDADIQISDIDYLWKRFSFSALNYDLSVPMTLEEIAINNSSSPDLSKLTVYPFEFAPSVVNSPLQSVTILLRNHGYLETSFHIHLPNEKQLELENWCDEDDPSEELNRIICIIEELKLFTIEPREARLMPGESCVLKVSYKHSSLKYSGIHNLPVLVKLSQGKQFYLDLRGQTLASTTTAANRKSSAKVGLDTRSAITPAVTPGPSFVDASKTAVLSAPVAPDILLVLGCHRHDDTVHLAPVPIGLSPISTGGFAITDGTYTDSAPLQKTELINVSAFNVNYEVFISDSLDDDDLYSVDIVKKNNFHLEVLRCANNAGTVSAGSSVFLEWYFYALEEKEYEFPVVIKYSSQPSATPSFANNDSFLSTAKTPGTAKKPSTSSTTRMGTAKSAMKVGSMQDSISVVPTVTKYLTAKIKVVGYDPRKPKPLAFETRYEGGLPCLRPVLRVPDKPVMLFEDLLDFNVIPQRCASRRILTIINNSPTAFYEFAIDESSSQCCLDNLVSVNPVFGKIEPLGKTVVEFVFQGYAQTMVFEDHIKIMVREIIRASNKSRGGTRQQILDRIKARKVQFSEHESVVSRVTFARSMQVLLNPHGELARPVEDEDLTGGDVLEERKKKTAKFPTTISVKGAVVVPDLKSTIHKVRPDNDWADSFAVQPNGSETLMVSDNKATAHKLDFEASATQGMDSPSRGKLQSSGSYMSEGGMSRGALTTSGERSTTSRKGTSADSGGHTLFGTTYILIARMRGEVFSQQTVKMVFERVAVEGRSDNLLQEFILPKDNAFIPPVGKKFFDPEFIQEQEKIKNKSKVNIAFIQGRDAELREITHSIFDSLMKVALNLPALSETVADTVADTNLLDIKLTEQPPINPFPAANNKFGIFYKEIEPVLPLHQKLIVECKYLGLLSGSDRFDVASADLQDSAWKHSEDNLLLLDDTLYSLQAMELKDVLQGWRMYESACFRDVIAQLDYAEGAESRLNIKDWVYSLTVEQRKALERRVNSARDRRGAGSSSLGDSQELQASPPTDEAQQSVSAALSESLASEDFLAVATESLNTLFLHMLKEELCK